MNHSSLVKRVGDSGIYTAEGNVAGAKAAAMSAQREKEREEHEKKKAEIEKEKRANLSISIGDKFKKKSNMAEQTFKHSTIGLKTADEYRKALSQVDNEMDNKVKADLEKKQRIENEKKLASKKRKQEEVKKSSKMLSFNEEEEQADDGEEADEITIKKSKKMKNPNVETSFLPDKEREEALESERAKLEEEYKAEQNRIKQEPLQVTYSFWDGSGHRRKINVTKGTTIGKFLELARQDLVAEFPELRGTHAENMIYIKEDLIIPHHYSFYYLILTKARGKSGPLFHFDVHDDVRLKSDATIEKEESHPGKVCLRAWFERNKHIFPCSRWTNFDPNNQIESYTIHGDK